MIEHAVLASGDVYVSVHVTVSCLELALLQMGSISQQEPGHEYWNDKNVDCNNVSSVRLKTYKIRRLLDQQLYLESNA